MTNMNPPNSTEHPSTNRVLDFLADVRFVEKSPTGAVMLLKNDDTKEVTKDELAALDPRLPFCIDNTVYDHIYKREGLHATDLAHTIKFWDGSYPKLQTTDEKSIAVLLLQKIQQNGDTVALSGWFKKVLHYKTAKPASDNPSIYLDIMMLGLVEVERSWLDQNYPCWLNRVSIAASLDITGLAQVQYILSRAPTPDLVQTSLPELG